MSPGDDRGIGVVALLSTVSAVPMDHDIVGVGLRDPFCISDPTGRMDLFIM